MELELGLKITKTRDDISSISEYQLAKDKGPVFQSRETNTTFILTAHLKGYKRNNIDIKISKDGNKITISGEKPIQEMVMIGWVMQKKVVDVTGFNKVFKIPKGVNLDRINAKYDEDEWILSIVMPKLVKGICGLRIEEVKEEEFDKRISEKEKSKTDHVSSSVGETSQRGSKDPEVQDMEGSKNNIDKMVDDANKEMNEERIKRVGESNLGNGEDVREKVGKEEYEEMKTSELEKNRSVCISQRIEDARSQDKESEGQKMKSKSVEQKKGRVYDKMLDDANEDITGSTVEKEKEHKLRNEDDKLEGRIVGATQITGVTSQGVSEEFLAQQSGESKQKFGESKCETDDRLKENMKESSKMEPCEAMKVSEVDDQNLVDHILSNIGDTSQKEPEESRIQQKEKTKGTKGRIDGGKHQKTPIVANKDVEKTILGDTSQKDNINPKTATDNEDRECIREKPGKEGPDARVGIREQFPKHFPKITLEGSEELNVQKMEEIKDVKEEMIKRKGKEIEYFVEKGEGCERQKRVHVDANKDTREAIEEDNEKRKNGIEESGQHVGESTFKGRFELPKTIYTEDLPKKLVELDGSKGFKVENVEERDEMIKEGKSETESLMEKEEGEESEKRNEEANKVFDDSNKEMNEERIKKGIGESKMGIGDENGKGMRKKVGKEVYEVMKSSEKEKNVGVCIPQRIEDNTTQDKDIDVQQMERSVEQKEGMVSDKMLDDGNGDQTGSTIKNGREKSKLRIEDGKVKGVRQKIGKAAYDELKTSERQQDVGAGFSQNIEDSQDKESEDEEMKEKGSVVEKEKMESDNMIDDTKQEITEEIDKSNFGIEEGGGKSVQQKVGKEGCEAMKSSKQDQNLGACEDSLIQQSGNSKQKEFGESKYETEDGLEENMNESSMEPFEALKVSKLDDPNVVDHIPSNIIHVSQRELEKSKIQQMEKSKRTKGKIDGEQYENRPVEAKKDVEKTILGDNIQKRIIKPKIETENTDKECDREKPGMEGSDVIAAIREEFPKHLPKTTLEEAEAMNIQKKQEIQDLKEEMIKRKGNEIEYSVEKGQGERNKTMHDDANKGITRETVEEEIEKKKNGVELPKTRNEELPKKFVELDRSKGFKVAEEEEQKEMSKEEKVETQSLMKKAEGEYSDKRNEKTDKVPDDANKDMSEERIKKKVGEFKMGIGDGNGKVVRRKVGKEEYEVMKTLELEKNAGVCIPQRIEDTTSQDKESEVQKLDSAKKEGRVLDKMVVDGNGDQTGSTIKKGREESKLRIEDGKMKGKNEKTSKATYEAMKTSEIEQDVGVGFPQNIGDISQDKEFKDHEMEKGSIVEKEKMQSDNMLHDTNEEITDEIEKSKFGIEVGGGKSGKEKVGNEGCEEIKSSEHEGGVLGVPNSITEELPKQLEELDGSKELKSVKEEEQKEVTEEANAETEILMEEMEEDSKKRNEEASTDIEKSTVIETLLKKTKESNIEKKSSDGSFVQEKLPKPVVEASFQDEKNKTEHGMVKLKEKGSTKMHVEPNEAFENDITGNRIEKEIRKQKLESSDQLSVKENVNNEIFDGRKRQKFPGMEEPEYAKDDGTKNEGYVKKVTRDKYEKIHVQANEDLMKDITKETRGEDIKDPKIQTKEKGEHHLHEEMSKERSQQSKAAKELNIREKFPKQLPKTTLKESEELSVQKMQEIKDVREEMIKRKGNDTEHFVEKGEGERHKPMHVDANKGIKRETTEDDMEKRKNGIDQSGQQYLEKNTVKGRFKLPGTMTEELPKKLVELDGSKGLKISEEEEQREMIKAEKDKTECFMEREEGEESKKINEVVDKVLDDANTKIKDERVKKEVGESNMGIGDGNRKGVRKKVGKEEHEEMMDTLELEKIVGECIPQRIQDTTSKDKKSKVPKMDSRNVKKKDGKEQFPKHLPKATLEESEESNVQKMREFKNVKEEMIKTKGKEIEYSEEKADGEKHRTMNVEENKGTTRETMQENIEKKKIRVDESGQHVGENIVKGVFEVPKSIIEELPKKLEELDGSKEVKVAKEAEQKEVTKEAMDETEILMGKNEGEESKRNEEASSGTEKIRVIETLLKKPEESNIEKKSSDGPFIKEKLPKKVVEEIAEAEKDKTEHGIVKMHVEPNEAFENDTTGNRIEKDARKQKHESSDQSSMKEIVNNEIFDGIKRENFPEMKEDENAKEDGAKIEQPVKKVNGDKYEKIQVEENEDFKKEITKETKGKEIEDPKIQTKEKGEHHLHEEMSKEISKESKSARNDPFKDTVQKEKEEPRILNKVKDQQCMQEDMSKGRYVASTTAREFPMQIVDSLAKTRERPKNKEAEEAKGNLAKRKSGEIKVVESRTKEKFQGTESEKITQILHEAPEEKHPKAFEIGTPERELQSERGHTTSPKVVNMGLKEAEQGKAKDKKQKTRPLPPKPPSKETHGSEDEGVNQYDFKPKQTKEVGEQHNYNTQGPKEVAAKEDQEIKPSSSPWFPSTQQSEVKEKDKFYEGVKAKYEASRESQKKDLTKDMQNFIEMKENQEGKQKEALESMKTTQEKEHPIKSEAVEKETESLEETSSLPNVTSMGVKEESPKKEIEDLHQKELSPLKAEMKSKEPIELEKPVIQWKLPKTEEHVPLTELRDKEQQHSYFTEEIEEQKIAAYEGAKPSKFQRQIITQQSTDDENRKSENDVEEHEASKESPKINIVETEQIESFQPLGNEYYEQHKFDEQDEALDQCNFEGQKILNEDRGQQHVQDNNDNKGSQTPKDVEEEMFMKEMEGSKVAKSGEAKDSSRNKRERGKTTHSPEEKKPKMKEKTSHFEKASGSKQVADKMHETGDREHQIDSEEVTSNSKVGVEPPTMIEKTPNKEVERKEPDEITWPNMDYEAPQISEVQEEMEGERHVHALEENISKEELAQATATYSNTKSEAEPKGENAIDKPQVNQLPSPSKEMLSKEPQESEECSMKECDSKGETIVQVNEKREPIHSTEGTTASEEVSVKEESQEAKKDSKTVVQEPNKGKREQQCINKEEEEKYGIKEIEEEKASEEGLEEQKEYKEEASGGKKDDTTMPKKLFVPLVIAGSALLGGIFVWHRRTRKR